jgi:DNA-binding response OmpR family regulator
MPELEQAALLAVGVDAKENLAAEVLIAATGRRAIELMRLMQFDLLVVAPNIADMPLWQFVQRVRMTRPWQRWALATDQLTPQEEVTARSLGVIGIFKEKTDWPELLHVAESIRRRTGAAVPAGRRSVAEPARLHGQPISASFVPAM